MLAGLLPSAQCVALGACSVRSLCWTDVRQQPFQYLVETVCSLDCKSVGFSTPKANVLCHRVEQPLLLVHEDTTAVPKLPLATMATTEATW